MPKLSLRLSAFLLTALFAVSATAQQFAISGRLCERSDTLTPLPLCSIELLRATDSLRIAYTTTAAPTPSHSLLTVRHSTLTPTVTRVTIRSAAAQT